MVGLAVAKTHQVTRRPARATLRSRRRLCSASFPKKGARPGRAAAFPALGRRRARIPGSRPAGGFAPAAPAPLCGPQPAFFSFHAGCIPSRGATSGWGAPHSPSRPPWPPSAALSPCLASCAPACATRALGRKQPRRCALLRPASVFPPRRFAQARCQKKAQRTRTPSAKAYKKLDSPSQKPSRCPCRQRYKITIILYNSLYVMCSIECSSFAVSQNISRLTNKIILSK